MTHPLGGLSDRALARAFWPLLAATLTLTVLLQIINAPLMTHASPSGIVSFEFAARSSSAQAMLAAWDADARAHAGLSLGLDYLYMVAYSTTIALGCLGAGRVLSARRMPLAGWAVPLAWGAWVAALADGTENISLIVQLFGAASDLWAGLAAACATLKFTLIVLGLLFALYGAAALWRPVPSLVNSNPS